MFTIKVFKGCVYNHVEYGKSGGESISVCIETQGSLSNCTLPV